MTNGLLGVNLSVNLGLGIVLGLVSNLFSEAFLSFDPIMRLPFAQLNGRQRLLRLLRWVTTIAALGLVSTFGIAWDRLVAIALMTVTASTDFECRLLPPGWFVYGAVIFGVVSPFVREGIWGVIDAAVAQAVCYAAAVLLALWSRTRTSRIDPGDIRALQQLGSAAGSLSIVWTAILSFSMIGLAAYGLFAISRRQLKAMPLATLVWGGLVVVPVVLRALSLITGPIAS